MVMRASGPVVPAAPVAPVVRRKRSPGSKDGSIAANCGIIFGPAKGGTGFGLFSVLGVFGAPPKVGAGRVV